MSPPNLVQCSNLGADLLLWSQTVDKNVASWRIVWVPDRRALLFSSSLMATKPTVGGLFFVATNLCTSPAGGPYITRVSSPEVVSYSRLATNLVALRCGRPRARASASNFVGLCGDRPRHPEDVLNRVQIALQWIDCLSDGGPMLSVHICSMTIYDNSWPKKHDRSTIMQDGWYDGTRVLAEADSGGKIGESISQTNAIGWGGEGARGLTTCCQ